MAYKIKTIIDRIHAMQNSYNIIFFHHHRVQRPKNLGKISLLHLNGRNQKN